MKKFIMALIYLCYSNYLESFTLKNNTGSSIAVFYLKDDWLIPREYAAACNQIIGIPRPPDAPFIIIGAGQNRQLKLQDDAKHIWFIDTTKKSRIGPCGSPFYFGLQLKEYYNKKVDTRIYTALDDDDSILELFYDSEKDDEKKLRYKIYQGQK